MLFIVENLDIDIPSNITRVAIGQEILPALPKQNIIYKDLPRFFGLFENENKIPAILGIPQTKENASLIYKLSLNYSFECNHEILKYGELETLFYYNFNIHSLAILNETYKLAKMKLGKTNSDFRGNTNGVILPESIFLIHSFYKNEKFNEKTLYEFFLEYNIDLKNIDIYNSKKGKQIFRSLFDLMHSWLLIQKQGSWLDFKIKDIKTELGHTFYTMLSSKTFDMNLLNRLESISFENKNVKEIVANYMLNFFQRQKEKNIALRSAKDKINVNAGHLILTGKNSLELLNTIRENKIHNGYSVFTFNSKSTNNEIEKIIEDRNYKIFVFFEELPTVDEDLITLLFNKGGGIGLRVVLALNDFGNSEMEHIFKDNCNAIIEA